MANRAGFLRQSRELLDVAFDAGFVTREFQPLLFVAVRSRNQVFHQIARVVAGIAFQFVSLKCAGHFDYAKMRLMSEAFVIRRSLRRGCWRNRNRFRLLLANGYERTPNNESHQQTETDKSQFNFVSCHKPAYVKSSQQSQKRIPSLDALPAFALMTGL